MAERQAVGRHIRLNELSPIGSKIHLKHGISGGLGHCTAPTGPADRWRSVPKSD